MAILKWLCALLLISIAWCGVAAAEGSQPRRIAVVVGANAAAPGRKPLRFSQADAGAFARVLLELGGFAYEDVHVLLDPDPALVLSTLDTALAGLHGEAIVVFYYSGHADAGALYPRGRALSFGDLRERLSDTRASVRIGIIDACRGGGWTGTKGLSEIKPFEVTLPMVLNNEGSVLIASSSGLEDAHESEFLGGSFFTHYWNAGLRGAADGDSDGRVTLTEAFEYAKALTIRDSALYTQSPQHPSFAMNLRGRQDLALSTVSEASAVLTVAQHLGPLELVHLGSGVVVLEIPKGERSMRLAVAPGRYLLRRRSGEKTWAHEIAVVAGQTTRIDEERLELLGQPAMAIKREEPRPLTLTTLRAGDLEYTMQVGISHSESTTGLQVSGGHALQFRTMLPLGLTDRLQWLIPTFAFAYRVGEFGHLEWVPWGGLIGWDLGYDAFDGLLLAGSPGVGSDLRAWLTTHSSLDFGFGVTSRFHWRSVKDPYPPTPGAIVVIGPERTPQFDPPDTWRASVSAGYTYTLADSVTFHVALSFSQNLLYEGDFPRLGARRAASDMVVSIGSVQSIGLRPQPLVRIHLSDAFALDLYVSVRDRLAAHKIEETYLIGFSRIW